MRGDLGMDEKTIRLKIAEIKETLSFLESAGWGVKFVPIADFDYKHLYPLDFQIFMEEIGELTVASEPNMDGYLIVDIQAPIAMTRYKDHSVTCLFECFPGETIEGVPAEKAMLVACDTDSDSTCYDTTVHPYQLFRFSVKPERFEGSLFIQWLDDEYLQPEVDFIRKFGHRDR